MTTITASPYVPADLDFDEPTHTYTYRCVEMLSVTKALSAVGLIDTTWFRAEDAIRGAHVHALISATTHGEPITPPYELIPYLAGYDAFLAESGFVAHASEERLCNPALRCAGTLDLRGTFECDDRTVDLIDVKTGSVPSWAGYQVAGYARLLPRRATVRVRRWALHLRDTGRYTLLPLTKRSDDAVFLGALTVAQAQRGWL